jgi:hypothetical protein
VNIREPDPARRWAGAGRPPVPSLLIDGVASPILHVSQLASILGLRAPAQLESTRLAWDTVAVLDAWVKLIGPLDLETLVAPTPSRGRSVRNLTVNVFHPFELLPVAFETGRFDWDPDLDDRREATLQDAASAVAYASNRSAVWQDWLKENETRLLARNPEITSPRGGVTYSSLLDSQRWHAAFHYRQLLVFLDGRRHDLTRALSLESLGGLNLPQEVF